MEANPYAPPQAAVADPAGDQARPEATESGRDDHATPEADSGPFIARVELSGLMTFFFSVFYPQWAINRYIVGTQG